MKAPFAGVVRGGVVRHALPGLGALNFVMHGALGGGVTRSLALDAHGKCLAPAILDLEVPDGDEAAFDAPRRRRIQHRARRLAGRAQTRAGRLHRTGAAHP